MVDTILLMAQLWTSSPKADPNVVLSGSWQSCSSEDGYGEKVYDRIELDKNNVRTWLWSFHMGPYHEFALYRADRDPVGEDSHSHDNAENLLAPSYEVVPQYNRAQRTWKVEGRKLRLPYDLWINVVLAGGSRSDCESFLVLVRKERSK